MARDRHWEFGTTRHSENIITSNVHSLRMHSNTAVAVHSFIHNKLYRAHVESVESEALEAVARWSVIGKIVSF